MAEPSIYDGNYFTDADQLGKSTGLGERNAAAVQQALALIKAFAKRSGGSCWPHLTRARVASDITTRLQNPDSMNQGQTWLCGIASFVRTWVFDFPVEYATLAINLFERGYGSMTGQRAYGSRVIAPSRTLLTSTVGEGVAPGDWIVLASIRENLNDVFDYTAGEGIFRIKAWNFPSDVVREFKALGYKKVVNTANGVVNAGYQNLMEASAKYDAGWRVILLINSTLLKNPIPADLPSTSNHWIGLNQSITVNTFSSVNTVFPFEVYSWDGLYTVPRSNQPLPLKTLTACYFGYVAGRY